MNSALLLEHYSRIADAPDAIGRLRRFVLDLAVRGKLVEQDADDEPASALLKRIVAEKARLVNAGELRKPRDLDNGGDLLNPWPVPTTWQWARLDAIGAIVGGGTPPAGDADNFLAPGEGIPWLTPADLGGYSDLYITRGSRDISEKGARVSSATLMPTGTILFTSRAPIGYVAIASNPISTNQGFKSIVPYVPECSRFVALAMKAFAPQIDASAPGTTFKEVSGKIVAGVPFPLPPLAEQHRVVAKADELMALCDQLEAARAEREAARDRFTLSALAKLDTPDPETFGNDTRFALANLTPLTARPDQIKQLRQTILNLAVRGRLVEQDSNDEPADAVLQRLGVAKDAMVRRGDLRKIRPAPPISEDEMFLSLPAGWCWGRLQNVMDVRDGTHDSPRDYTGEDGYPLVTSKDFKNGEIDFSGARRISPSDHSAISVRSRVDRDDILFSMIGGNIGNQVIVQTDRPFSIKNVALFKHYSPHDFIPHYVKLFTEHLAQSLQSNASGGAQPFVSLGYLRNLVAAVPPVAEQHRIVAKVDHLMSLCDQLEANIVISEAIRGRLTEAVLHNALEPV